MRLTILSFATIAIALLVSFKSNAEISIESLLERGDLRLQITAKGGHQGNCLRIIAENTGEQFYATRMKPGRILHAGNTNEQDILLTEEVIIALSPSQRLERNVHGFCFQSSDASPQEGTAFYLGPQADEYARKTAAYLNQHRDIHLSTQQAAVWTLSDCHPISAIDRKTKASDDFVNFLSTLLNLPKPWYTTEHLQTVDALFSPRVLRIYGEIPFQVDSYIELNVQISDPNGDVKKVLMQQVRYGPGSYTMPLDIRVDHWPAGPYEVKLMSDGVPLKTEVFEL